MVVAFVGVGGAAMAGISELFPQAGFGILSGRKRTDRLQSTRARVLFALVAWALMLSGHHLVAAEASAQSSRDLAHILASLGAVTVLASLAVYRGEKQGGDGIGIAGMAYALGWAMLLASALVATSTADAAVTSALVVSVVALLGGAALLTRYRRTRGTLGFGLDVGGRMAFAAGIVGFFAVSAAAAV